MTIQDSQEFQSMKIDEDEKLKRKQAKKDLRFALANGLSLPLKSKGRVTMQRREEERIEHERLYDAWRKKRTDAGLPISGDIIAKRAPSLRATRTPGEVNALIKDARENRRFVEMKPAMPPKESRHTIKEKMGEVVAEVTSSTQSSVIKDKTDEIMVTVETPGTGARELSEKKNTISASQSGPQNTFGIVFEQVPAYKCS